jgi:rhamnopyranosyl-N-acetylglucosaminyl-diphospho-decaprenol beta-1,3/1,4-galactofuranosyltransferase
MEKVIAVVVTYNRVTLLSECITALRNQTRKPDAILIVNNGSTDTTEQWLQQQPDIHFINQKNVGSSGGFSSGINWAYKNGYSWIWCMDDDGYPKEDALDNLLQADDGTLRLYNCAVVNKENKKDFVWKTADYKTIDDVKENIIKGIGHPFNGTMLHRRIVERVGVPQPKFFLWGDETEYYYRIIKQNEIPVCTVASSIHYHPASAFTYKQDWDYKSTWKMYFYVRNRLFIHKAKFSNKAVALINYCCFLAAFAGIVMVYQKTNKLKKLGFIMWPAVDAFKNNFSATPPLILAKLATKADSTFNSSFVNGIKNIWSLVFTPSSMVKKMQPR